MERNEYEGICKQAKHKKKYASEIDRAGIVGREKSRFEVAAAAFSKHPSADNWQQLEQEMVRYQNIVCNTGIKRDSE